MLQDSKNRPSEGMLVLPEIPEFNEWPFAVTVTYFAAGAVSQQIGVQAVGHCPPTGGLFTPSKLLHPRSAIASIVSVTLVPDAARHWLVKECGFVWPPLSPGNESCPPATH